VRLEAARKDLADAKRKHHRASHHSHEAKRKYSRAKRRCDRAEHDARRAERSLGDKRRTLQRLRSKIAVLSSQLNATPDKIRQDVIKVFRYPVTHITRRCDAVTTLELQTAWQPAGAVRHNKAGASTQDDTHAAYPRYGVDADPLQFPLSDSSLMDRADRAMGKQLLASVRKRVVSYYSYMSDRAIEWRQKDPAAASDIMVAVVLAGRRHVDKASLARFAAHLRQHYGLNELRSLML
jgi:hypothetical protein